MRVDSGVRPPTARGRSRHGGQEHDLPLVRQGRGGCRPLLRQGVPIERQGGRPPGAGRLPVGKGGRRADSRVHGRRHPVHRPERRTGLSAQRGLLAPDRHGRPGCACGWCKDRWASRGRRNRACSPPRWRPAATRRGGPSPPTLPVQRPQGSGTPARGGFTFALRSGPDMGRSRRGGRGASPPCRAAGHLRPDRTEESLLQALPPQRSRRRSRSRSEGRG